MEFFKVNLRFFRKKKFFSEQFHRIVKIILDIRSTTYS